MSEGLKPCPFCNDKAEVWEDNRGFWFVDCTTNNVKKCNVCPGLTDPQPNKEQAIAVWNTRSLEPISEEAVLKFFNQVEHEIAESSDNVKDFKNILAKKTAQKFGKPQIDRERLVEIIAKVEGDDDSMNEFLADEIIKELER